MADDDDFLAIDHRHAELSCRLELFAAGRSWLGPTWMFVGESATTSIPKPPVIDSRTRRTCLAEWSYRAGHAHITHSALLLREQSLALISALIERVPRSIRLPLSAFRFHAVITATPIVDSRGSSLRPPKKPGSAQVLADRPAFASLSYRSGSVPDRSDGRSS